MEVDRKRIPLDGWIEAMSKPLMPSWKLYSGLGVTGHARVERVLKLVDMARRAELEGRALRADFFWKEAHLSLRASWLQGGEWIRVAREVFWETHWALVRGGLRDKNPEDIRSDARAFVHLGWIRSLETLLPEESAASRSDLEAALRLQVHTLERAARLKEAWKRAGELQQLAPENSEYPSRAAEIQMAIVSKALDASGDDITEREQALRSAIVNMTRLRGGERPILSVLQAEAVLRQQLAIALANDDRLSDALLESRKALALDPWLEGGKETFEKLVEFLSQMQEQANSIREEVQAGNRQLSSKGEWLLREAERGYGPVNAFLESQEYQELTALYEKALTNHVWREVSLADPEPEDSRPKDLIEEVSRILTEKPEDPAALEAAWNEAVDRHASLQDLNPVAAVAFLHRRLFPDDPNAPEPLQTRWVAQLSDGPSIELPPERSKRDGEPFEGWLYSRSDLRVKFQCVAALLLIVTAFLFGVREVINRGIRAEAYQQARVAASLEDLPKAMEAAGRFLEHRVAANDSRESEMTMLYDEALVNWVLREDPAEDELRKLLELRKAAMTFKRSE
jgi:hypothetical protein